MLVIVGLLVLLVAAIVAIVSVLSNAGAAHPLTENFSVFGYHFTGSTGGLFLFGIVVGAVALLGLVALLAGARRSLDRRRDNRRAAALFQREMAFINRDPFINRDHDTRFEHQESADAARSGRSADGRVATD